MVYSRALIMVGSGFPGERSHSWHTSYGGGIWLTFLNKFTTKYSWFGSTDSFRFAFELGLGF